MAAASPLPTVEQQGAAVRDADQRAAGQGGERSTGSSVGVLLWWVHACQGRATCPHDLDSPTVSPVLQIQQFKPGDTIIRKGDHGDQFYMIKSGRVVCTGIGSGATVRCRRCTASARHCTPFTSSWSRGDVCLLSGLLVPPQVMADEYLSEGGYFGERALLMSVPRGANVIAQEQVPASRLSRCCLSASLC